jgi:hypothetical protein
MEPSRRRRRGERDRISGLPDELLHVILRHLRSAAAAARTSALSHRWRRVWAHSPDLVFGDDLIRGVEGDGASFLDAVDGALAAYSDDRALHVDSLKITVPRICGENVTASRVEPWLRFAMQRLAGEFFLSVPHPKSWPRDNRKDDKLELPPCKGVTKIQLQLGLLFFLRIPPAGMFGALADLVICQTTMDGPELGVIVSSHCPRLQNLTLDVVLVADSDISVRSASLRCLRFCVLNTRRLDITAPMLEILGASNVDDARIAAPDLVEVDLSNILGQVVVADAGRHLRLLDVTWCSTMVASSLMRRFDSVINLRLRNPNVRFLHYRQLAQPIHVLTVSFYVC